MAYRYFGVVTCNDRSAAVHVTSGEADDLARGRLPCPCCGQRCGSRFRIGALSDAASSSMSWGGASWLAAEATHRE